jgi:hypothetical protein
VFHRVRRGILRHEALGGDLQHWLFFSLATATTLGFADVSPVTASAQTLVGLETIVCTGWMVAVVAAFTAHLQPQFQALEKKGTHDLANGRWGRDEEGRAKDKRVATGRGSLPKKRKIMLQSTS